MASDLAAALADRGVGIRTGSTVRELRRRTGRVAADRRSDHRRGGARRRRRRARPPAGPGRPAAAPAVAPRAAAAPRRDRLRLDGHRHRGPPAGRRRPAGRFRASSSRRSSRWTIKARDVQLGQVGLARPRPPTHVYLRASLGRAGEAATLQRDDDDLVRPALADLGTVLGGELPARSTRTCSAGAAPCRSTPSATSTAHQRGPRGGGRCPGWPSPAPRTTASAYRPCIASGRARPAREVLAALRQPTMRPHDRTDRTAQARTARRSARSTTRSGMRCGRCSPSPSRSGTTDRDASPPRSTALLADLAGRGRRRPRRVRRRRRCAPTPT